jgi:hypothetical protein
MSNASHSVSQRPFPSANKVLAVVQDAGAIYRLPLEDGDEEFDCESV